MTHHDTSCDIMTRDAAVFTDDIYGRLSVYLTFVPRILSSLGTFFSDLVKQI